MNISLSIYRISLFSISPRTIFHTKFQTRVCDSLSINVASPTHFDQLFKNLDFHHNPLLPPVNWHDNKAIPLLKSFEFDAHIAKSYLLLRRPLLWDLNWDLKFLPLQHSDYIPITCILVGTTTFRVMNALIIVWSDCTSGCTYYA